MNTHQFLVALAAMSGAMYPTIAPASDVQPGAPADALAGRPLPAVSIPVAAAAAVVDFWREAGPGLWFAKDSAFDRLFRERFLSLYEAATRGELDEWAATPDGALALVLLLDQFPRNAFRGAPRMYATDAMARKFTTVAIDAGHDRMVDAQLQLFFYLPLGHSENLADQERSVALAVRLGEPSLSHAIGHRDIIRRFGRFPHRNPILGRTTVSYTHLTLPTTPYV